MVYIYIKLPNIFTSRARFSYEQGGSIFGLLLSESYGMAISISEPSLSYHAVLYQVSLLVFFDL